MIQLVQRMDLNCTEKFPAHDLPCVLLIEDSNDLQVVIQLGLELMSGIQVITTQTTDNWLWLIQCHHPDVIVLELFASDNHILEILKHNPQMCHIPIVGLVMRDRSQDIFRAKAKGVSAIVSKPFEIETLRDTIFDVLT